MSREYQNAEAALAKIENAESAFREALEAAVEALLEAVPDADARVLRNTLDDGITDALFQPYEDAMGRLEAASEEE